MEVFTLGWSLRQLVSFSRWRSEEHSIHAFISQGQENETIRVELLAQQWIRSFLRVLLGVHDQVQRLTDRQDALFLLPFSGL